MECAAVSPRLRASDARLAPQTGYCIKRSQLTDASGSARIGPPPRTQSFVRSLRHLSVQPCAHALISKTPPERTSLPHIQRDAKDRKIHRGNTSLQFPQMLFYSRVGPQPMPHPSELLSIRGQRFPHSPSRHLNGSSGPSPAAVAHPTLGSARKIRPDEIGIPASTPASPANPLDAERDCARTHTIARSRYRPPFDSLSSSAVDRPPSDADSDIRRPRSVLVDCMVSPKRDSA